MVMTVIIADNHPIFRDGVKTIIEDSDLFKVIGEASDGEACVYKVSSLSPDILIIDLSMPKLNGFEVVEKIRAAKINCRIFVLSMHSSSDFASHAKQIGCNGFIAKADASIELLSILNSHTESFLTSSSVGREEEDELLPPKIESATFSAFEMLTTTEKLVLKYVAQSLSSSKISKHIGVSVRTVHTHRLNISKKLGLSGANNLLKYALEHRDDISKL
jgi:DNA-binding NarL/FixJ family response regulator